MSSNTQPRKLGNANRTQPLDRIGQGTTQTREYALRRPEDVNSPLGETINLDDADRVELSLSHVTGGGSMVSNGHCEIVEPARGIVSYSFSRSETWMPAGDYHVQFEIDWSDGQTETLPPDGYDTWIELGPTQGQVSINADRVWADNGVFGNLESDHFETDTLTVNRWIAGLIGDTTQNNHISRLDGSGLEVGPTGSLDVVTDSYLEDGPHTHVDDTEGSDQLYPRDLRTAGHPVHDATHPDHGAEGDGVAADNDAIQAAVDAAIDDGVPAYLPPGVYRLDPSGQAITADGVDGLHITGAGRYQTIIKPDFNDDESQRVGDWARFSNCSNITLSNIGIDGTEASDHYYDPQSGGTEQDWTEVISGGWARANFRDCDNVTVRNVWADMVKHVVDVRDSTNVTYDDIRHHRCFNGPHTIRCEQVHLSDIHATECTTVADFAQCEHFSLVNFSGTANAYAGGDDNTKVELVDCGGSQHGRLSDGDLSGSPGAGIRIKGESNAFDSISIDNLTVSECDESGVTLGQTNAESTTSRDVSISNLRVGHSGEADASGVIVDQPVENVKINSPDIRVDGTGIEHRGGTAAIEGGSVISEGSAAINSYRAYDDQTRVTINGTTTASRSDPELAGVIRLSSNHRPRLENVVVRDSPGRDGIELDDCQGGTIADPEVRDVRQNAVRVTYSSVSPLRVGSSSAQLSITNLTAENWGLGASTRGAVRLSLDAGANVVTGIHITGGNFNISDGDVADQHGIIVDGDTPVEDSYFDRNTMTNVQGAILDDSGLLADSVATDNK